MTEDLQSYVIAMRLEKLSQHSDNERQWAYYEEIRPIKLSVCEHYHL